MHARKDDRERDPLTAAARAPDHRQERMANMLNDCEISPTNYMIAFLRQRGWYLPDTTMRIPNVIPEVDPIAAKVGRAPGAGSF